MKHVSEILWWRLPQQQLLTTLSLSSLPSYRKAETESGKLVTVKNPLICQPLDLCCCHQRATATGRTGRKLQPHHIQGHTILQPYWSIQCQIITISVMPKCCSDKCNFLCTWWFWSQDLGEVLGKAVAVFQLVLHIHRWCFLWKFGDIYLFTVLPRVGGEDRHHSHVSMLKIKLKPAAC